MEQPGTNESLELQYIPRTRAVCDDIRGKLGVSRLEFNKSNFVNLCLIILFSSKLHFAIFTILWQSASCHSQMV